MSHSSPNEAKLIDVLRRHFEATLEMLGRVIDDCPDEVWDVKEEPAPIWQQLYHSLIGLDFWIRECTANSADGPAHFQHGSVIMKGLFKRPRRRAGKPFQLTSFCQLCPSKVTCCWRQKCVWGRIGLSPDRADSAETRRF